MKDGQISGYLYTKYKTVPQIDKNLHNFEDQKLTSFFNLEQVNFCMTLVI